MPLRGRELGAFLALTLIWGTTWAAIRLGLAGFPPFAGIGVRFLLAGGLLWLVARLRGERFAATKLARRLWLYNAFATFVVPYGVIYWAEQTVPTGLCSVLFATFPLWLAVWSRWLLPEARPTFARFAGVALGFAGVAIIFSEDFDELGGEAVRWRGLALLAAAAVSATGSLAVKRWGSGISPLSTASIPMLLTGLLAAGVSLAGESWSSIVWGTAPVLATLYLAVVGSAVSFSLYFWLLAKSSAVLAALVSYTAPVVAVLVGLLLFDEPLTGRIVAGAILVLAGVAGVLRSR